MRVQGALGALTFEEGTQLTGNIRGLRVTDTGNAISANTNQANPVVFGPNTQEGILVDSGGWVTIAATAGKLGAGSVIATGNATGFAATQTGPGAAAPQNVLHGFVAWKNTLAGLHVEGGSSVDVLNSYLGGNGIGAEIVASSTGAVWQNDTSSIKLGSNATTGVGKNTLQSPGSTDGGPSAHNTLAGVCYGILPSKGQTLYAYGNYWADHAGTGTIDCSQAIPGALSAAAACVGGVDVAGPSVPANTNTIGVANCTH
jgi:hypothetical protein